MFDLEGAISQWRERLSWRDAFTNADLDEMESHLRDEIESLVASGNSEQQAFHQTIRSFDEDMKLAWRFNQANWEKVMIKRTRYAPIMIGNYFNVALRNLLKYKLYSIINIVGLAIGIACSLLIFLFVRDELAFDHYHEKSDRIYRVNMEWHYNNGDLKNYAGSSVNLAPALLEEASEIKYATRLLKTSAYIKKGDHRFYEKDGYYADASVLSIFSFPLLHGKAETALSQPYSMVITKQMAQKYFQNENPLGQTLVLQDTINATVTGVLASIPNQSHFKFDFLLSFQTLHSIQHPYVTKWHKYWGNLGPYTYILLHDANQQEKVASQIYRITQRHAPEEEKKLQVVYKHTLIPMTDIYLHSDFLYEIGTTKSVKTVYIFLSIAMLILLMACINFMNLATARSINRAQEVGMRKVVGAHRRQLITQFLGEAFLMTCLAVIFAIVLIEIFLPPFNTLSNKALTLDLLHDPNMLLSLLVVTAFVGLIAGSYPAFALSKFQPVEVLKGVLKGTFKDTKIRQGLVVFQFTISIVLIIGTIVAINQLQYMHNQKLGFDKAHTVVIPFHDNPNINKRYNTLKTAFLNHAHVKSATASGTVPGRVFGDMKFVYEDKNEKSMKAMLYQHIDEDYIQAYDLEVIAGRNFSKDFPHEDTQSFMLNETAVAYLGLGSPKEALGANIDKRNNRRLIGVVKDFHHHGLQRAIEPLYFIFDPTRCQYLSIKIQSNNIAETLSALENIWQTQVPNRHFEFFFLDTDFEKQYQSEQHLSKIFTIFATLAIFIGCLGLFGLVAFAAQQRTREIGIRKILGASITGIVTLLSKDFVKLILIANLIAWPIAYYTLNQWLQTFAYRINLHITTFIFAGLIALLIALITISYQAIKAAQANPIDSLRYE